MARRIAFSRRGVLRADRPWGGDMDPDKTREMLDGWHKGLRTLSRANFSMASRYGWWNALVGACVVVFSGAAGSTVLANLGKSDPELQLKIGLVSIVATILASLQTFFKFSELSNRHKAAAVKYGGLRTEVQVLLASDLPKVADLDQKIESIRTRWQSIDQEAPTAPNYDRMERQLQTGTPSSPGR